MNKKSYWKIRKIILMFLFKLKSIAYRVINLAVSNSEYKSFRTMIAKNAFLGILKCLLFSFIIMFLDGFVLKIKGIPYVDKSVFSPVVIGGIAVAGVILGLYCANISSIFSTRYSNAPKSIANAFQYDRLTRRCISGIVDYIIFGFVVIFEVMFKDNVSWATVLVTSIWSVIVVISYSIAGNRAYQLSDVYAVANDSYRSLYYIITKDLNSRFFSSDANFQNYFLEVAEKQIALLKTIQKYGAEVTNSDKSAMTGFMCNNLELIEFYWKAKKSIGRNSLWFRNEAKYQKWHFTGDTETSLALQTGTSLRVKREHNFWWFEDEIMAINKACLYNLFEQHDFTSLYSYLLVFQKICKTAIECKEANYYVGHVDWLKKAIEKNLISKNDRSEEKKSFSGVVEVISLLYLDLILESSKYYQKFDINKIVSEITNSIDLGIDAEKSKSIRCREDANFYNKIITEVRVEGKRITPEWVIKQHVSKEEYVYLNSLIDIVREGMNHAFTLGKLFEDKELYFEACIILTRFYEYESKLTYFFDIARYRENELRKSQVDKKIKWDDFRIEKLQDTAKSWKETVPTLLSECACHFALDNWENREEYPDFLGECYNHICEDAVEAIIGNDIKQFEIDFDNLSKLMLLYQEYIRTDFIKNKDLYRVEYAYYMFTSPIVEWAQIGGLAILWGEFFSNVEWKKCIKKAVDSILKKNGKLTDLAEKMIEYIQHRDNFMFGIGSRDILETGWNQSVANAVRKSGKCQSEYVMFGMQLRTDSKLLKAFCSDFMDMGFTTDPSEVFWVLCVNPLLTEGKKFHTRNSWEDKLNDESI